MSEANNPNGVIRYCSDCRYFKEPFFLSRLFEEPNCTKIDYNTEVNYVRPEKHKPHYKSAGIVRNRECEGNYWEPKGK